MGTAVSWASSTMAKANGLAGTIGSFERSPIHPTVKTRKPPQRDLTMKVIRTSYSLKSTLRTQRC
ncbi:MAG: hypothetical protein QXU47_07335 [Candidatus Bathyarchaeia archaeon]